MRTAKSPPCCASILLLERPSGVIPLPAHGTTTVQPSMEASRKNDGIGMHVDPPEHEPLSQIPGPRKDVVLFEGLGRQRTSERMGTRPSELLARLPVAPWDFEDGLLIGRRGQRASPPAAGLAYQGRRVAWGMGSRAHRTEGSDPTSIRSLQCQRAQRPSSRSGTTQRGSEASSHDPAADASRSARTPGLVEQAISSRPSSERHRTKAGPLMTDPRTRGPRLRRTECAGVWSPRPAGSRSPSAAAPARAARGAAPRTP